MVTLCNNQDVLDRVGPYANSTIIASSAILDRYIELSEGVVISETGIDWITGIADINSYVQIELKSCVASHAAKQILMYDLEGVQNATAMTMLNVNELEFSRTLKTLKEFQLNKNIRSVPT